MYERMLNKQQKPSYEEFIDYCGDSKKLFEKVDDFLLNELRAEKSLRFPYGNRYGWSMKYFIKSKHICDIFAEKDAFVVMLRLTNVQFEKVYEKLTNYAKDVINNKHPCNEGGWIQYRVLTLQDLDDIKSLLQLKINK